MQINLETALNWSEKRIQQTRKGPKYLRTAEVDIEFLKLFKKNKEIFSKNGISLNNYKGKTTFAWWTDIEEPEEKVTQKLVIDRKLKAPYGLDYMDYQKEGICFGLNHEKILLADEMGLGKTIQVIGIMNNTECWKTAIIVCPKILMTNWKKELEKWLIKNNDDIVLADSKLSIGKILIINYEKLEAYKAVLSKMTFDFVIEDEAHAIKNSKAKRSKNTKSIKFNKKLIRVTGTPFLNRPVELFNLINDMSDTFKNWNNYVYRYCGAYRGRFGLEVKGATNINELQKLLYDTIMVRRLKEDVLDLPEKQRQIVYLKANRQQVKMLKEIETLNIDYEELFKNPDFSEYEKVLHQVSLSKIPQIIEYVDSVLSENENKKLVIGAIHHDVEELLVKGLEKYKPLLLNGETKEKQEIIDKFQNNNENRVIICGIKAAGIGITLTKADWLVFAELYYTPGIMNQFEDRIHRIGQDNNVLIQQFALENSIDENIISMLIHKQEIFEQAFNINKDKKKDKIKTTKVKNKKYIINLPDEKESEILDKEKELVLKALKILAGYDYDGAIELNGVGFNKIDSDFGRSLAKSNKLSDKQFLYAKKMCKKYWRQLPEDLVKKIWN